MNFKTIYQCIFITSITLSVIIFSQTALWPIVTPILLQRIKLSIFLFKQILKTIASKSYTYEEQKWLPIHHPQHQLLCRLPQSTQCHMLFPEKDKQPKLDCYIIPKICIQIKFLKNNQITLPFHKSLSQFQVLLPQQMVDIVFEHLLHMQLSPICLWSPSYINLTLTLITLHQTTLPHKQIKSSFASHLPVNTTKLY